MNGCASAARACAASHMPGLAACVLALAAVCLPALGQAPERPAASPQPVADCGPMRTDFDDPDAYLRQLAAKPLADFDLFELLYLRASTAELRRRLSAGAQPNSCGGQLNSSLLSAAALPSSGSLDNVRLLIEAGAGVDAPLSEGRSALAFAVGANNYEVAHELIRRGAHCAIRWGGDGTLMHELAHSLKDQLYQPEAELALAERLRTCGTPLDAVQNPERLGFTPLFYAVLDDKPQLAAWLLAHGADARRTDAKGRDAAALARSLKRDAVLQVLESHP